MSRFSQLHRNFLNNSPAASPPEKETGRQVKLIWVISAEFRKIYGLTHRYPPQIIKYRRLFLRCWLQILPLELPLYFPIFFRRSWTPLLHDPEIKYH